MIAVRRLLAVTAFLAVAALVTSSGAWGDPDKGKKGGKGKPVVKPEQFSQGLEKNRFADRPVVIYRDKGETYFALQVKAKLPEAAPAPVDYLVIVETSASKAAGYLETAQQFVADLAAALDADDRMAIWTANLEPRRLSRGFEGPKDLAAALAELKKEIPLGAVDLKKALTKALASFEVKASRRRVVLYLGDGNSVAAPLTLDGRIALSEDMVKKQAAFINLPLGERPNAQNLHGLSSSTGGKAFRLDSNEKPAEAIARLKRDVARPVLYDAELKLPAAAREVLPSVIPPVRGDAPLLLVGKLDGEPDEISYTLVGESGGKKAETTATYKVPASEPEHRFLIDVHGQWKARKDRPALLQADRALAYAYTVHRLAVEDLLAKAEIAIDHDRLDTAQKLYEQTRQLDPANVRAEGGLALIDKMRKGKLTREQMLKQLRLDAAEREVVRLENGKAQKVKVLDDDGKADPKDKGPDLAPRDPVADIKARKRIATEQASAAAGEAVRQANRLVRASPDEAYRVLEQALADAKGNTDLDPEAIRNLEARIVAGMRNVRRVGDVIKRDQAQALALRATADARLDLRRTVELAQDRVRERLRTFHNLMNQAREQEAYQQAQAIREDLVDQGLPVPQAVTAAYQIGLSAYHLRELRELRREREEKWLAVMLEVERSHVPYPDEPPITFPSAARIKRLTNGEFSNWKDWSKYRIARYSVATFGSDAPGRMFELQRMLNKTIDYAGIDERQTLAQAMLYLAKRENVRIEIDERAFRVDGLNNAGNESDGPEVASAEKPIPAGKYTLGSVLKKILSRVPAPSGATYVIRRDAIEITTLRFAIADKAVRIYNIADIVIPINPNVITPSGGIFGSFYGGGQFNGGFNQFGQNQFGNFNGGGGGFGGFNGGGGGFNGGFGGGGFNGGGFGGGGFNGGGFGGGGFNGGFGGGGFGGGGFNGGGFGGGGFNGGGFGGGGFGGGGFGGGGFNGGGFGGGGFNGGFGGGGFGGGGFNGGGFGGGGFGGGGFGGGGNGGGVAGFGGANGQQSALQAVRNGQVLTTLIKQTVGNIKKDWAVQVDPVTGQPINPLDDEKSSDNPDLNYEPNALGYYPPTYSLVVKAPSLLRTRDYDPPINKVGGDAPDKEVGGGVKVASDRDGRGDRRRRERGDPRKVWQEALARGDVEPGMIIATADFLALHGQFKDAAEFLKANLRKGVQVKPWVYRSLALALRESGGSAEEIERAEVSAADLEPLDAAGYLEAARALAGDKNYGRAMAFCQQAAELSPGLPRAYADGARYAEMGGDAEGLRWAAGKLLGQEWPVRNAEMHALATQKVEALSGRLSKDQAAQLRAALEASKRRDLVIKLTWQGEADMDLKVTEPTGSQATALNRQTVNGGTLLASGPGTGNAESYVAAQGFPGEYTVTVEKVWGRPLGNKAQLRITRHQGTRDETEQLITLRMNSSVSEPIRVKLGDGRRTETAYVPPSAHEVATEASVPVPEGSDEVLSKLRDLADPETTAVRAARQGGGGVTSSGRPVQRATSAPAKASDRDRTLYQNKVASFVQNSVEVTSQAVLSADRRHVRLSLNTVDNTGKGGPVRIVNSVFPGAADR